MHFAGTLAALVLALNVDCVFAALYPTQPIASTIYYAGKQATITWKDNRRWPSVNDMGDVQIELICKEELVATLEKSVSPIPGSCSVWIPGGLSEGSDYMMRFRSQHPPLSVYTAYFTIKADSNLPAKVNLANATTTQTLPNAAATAQPIPIATIKPSPAEPIPSHSSDTKDSRLRKNTAARLNPEASVFRTATIFLPSILGILMAI